MFGAQKQASAAPTGHLTYVHDTQVDPTGKFIATCSSDRTLKIFGRLDAFSSMLPGLGGKASKNINGCPWVELCSRTDHSATIHKVAWSHPSYGQYVATASADRTVLIYRLAPQKDSKTETVKMVLEQYQSILLYQYDTLSDIAFAPRHHEFTLAVACNDGCLRLFDAPKAQEIAKISPPSPDGGRSLPPALLSIAWCPSLSESSMTLICGSIDGSVVIRQYDREASDWSVAQIVSMNSPGIAAAANTTVNNNSSLGGAADSDPSLVRGSIGRPSNASAAGGAANNGSTVSLNHDGPVTCVVWAPSCGRRYELIASCCNRSLQIARLYPSDKGVYRCQLWRSTSDGYTRLAWNSTGTLLAAIRDSDGEATTFKASEDSLTWEPCATL